MQYISTLVQQKNREQEPQQQRPQQSHSGQHKAALHTQAGSELRRLCIVYFHHQTLGDGTNGAHLHPGRYDATQTNIMQLKLHP